MIRNAHIAAWFIGLIVFAAVAARCSSGDPNDVNAGDAGDAKDDPCPMNVPDAAEFSCEAGPPDSGGCVGPPKICGFCGLDFDSGVNYPLDCKATLPVGTTMCGPLVCTCKGGSYWECPQ